VYHLITQPLPNLLALDFDGVLCDGLEEYFQTSWQTHAQLWTKGSNLASKDLADRFFRLRPVIETGWEMPVLIEALLQGKSDPEILENWTEIASSILTATGFNPQMISRTLDGIRDEQIATNLQSWLSLQHFYPGVIETLQRMLEAGTQVFVITTKEGRFAYALLQQAGLTFPEEHIFGKETQCPKHQTLRSLLDQAASRSANQPLRLWFIEDRLKTLESVKSQADLTQVSLFLADWGYNTVQDRSQAAADDRIQLLSLAQFAGFGVN
jgi:phosphoglycolate phosphatase-like HAD superfamily hydrolase